MESNYEDDEKLYRAVRPAPVYWKDDGTLSSAAFKDKNGLSTDRERGRKKSDCISFMQSRKFEGSIVSVCAKMCKEVNAFLNYLPQDDNPYHTQIQNTETALVLTPRQAKLLAHNATMEYK